MENTLNYFLLYKYLIHYTQPAFLDEGQPSGVDQLLWKKLENELNFNAYQTCRPLLFNLY